MESEGLVFVLLLRVLCRQGVVEVCHGHMAQGEKKQIDRNGEQDAQRGGENGAEQQVGLGEEGVKSAGYVGRGDGVQRGGEHQQAGNQLNAPHEQVPWQQG